MLKQAKMCNAMQYIENFPTLWTKDNDKFFFICPSILQLENHVGMRQCRYLYYMLVIKSNAKF